MNQVISGFSFLNDQDIYFFKEGTHYRLYEKLGAHQVNLRGVEGTYFAVWAPNADEVSVIGDFNGWQKRKDVLFPRLDFSGIWEGLVPGVRKGHLYKYHIVSKDNDYTVEKTDPFAFYCEVPPQTSTVVWDLDYKWQDKEWMKQRAQHNSLNGPVSIYEVHLGSWRRKVEEDNRYLTYREMAQQLVEYVRDLGFTHVEFLPIMEHPFYGSWGYQTLGYFAPTSRYGTPQDFMFLIDALHQAGIGVILDWVPSHFPSDGHGLTYFDGSHVYEHADPQKGFHPDWKCYIFNNGRNEVKEFLISSALFWLDHYHADGLRVDAVASMLYLDYSRNDGEWTPNIHGGRENIESVAFIKQLNETVYKYYPDVQMFAEESTAWPQVSRPVHAGGLGFGMKWNMGWMHDTLEYFRIDPLFRKYHHNELTFSMLYAFTENFILSLSHDEVVYGKGSLLNKMPGDDWQKFANLRLLLGYMYGHCGKKLLFMGSELAQRSEWYHEQSLDWHLLQYAPHQGIHQWIKDLNRFYRQEPSLYLHDFDPKGFQWVECHDWLQSVLTFFRKGDSANDVMMVVCNFTPTPRPRYRVGVPEYGSWEEVHNSDDRRYGGSGMVNGRSVLTELTPFHGRPYSLTIDIPPLGASFFRFHPASEDERKKIQELQKVRLATASDQQSPGSARDSYHE